MRWLALLVFATGCGTAIRATAINPAPYPLRARPPETVEVFTSGPPQGRSFVDVAFMEAQQQSGYSVDDTPELIAKLRERAAEMGCDAIVFGGVTNRSGIDVFDWNRHMNEKGIIATCIVYTDQASIAAAAVRPVPPPKPVAVKADDEKYAY